MQRSKDPWLQLAIVQPGDTFRSVLKRVMSEYKGDEKVLICSILAWLSRDSDIIYHPVSQTLKQYGLLHVIGEQLGLKHYTIDYRRCRFFCQHHQKICSVLFVNSEYDEEHDCTLNEFEHSVIS